MIEHGTLAGSYNIVDRSTDHAHVLLNLPGKAQHEYFPPQDIDTYAKMYPSDIYDGITFNGDLVEQCQRFYVSNRFNNVEEALQTDDGLAYSAVIQETFEHELAHVKIRHDRVLNDHNDDTPGGPPLHLESGFGVQAKIRADNHKQDRILELAGNDASRFEAPLHLVWGKLEVDHTGLLGTELQPGGQVTRDQLVEHLKYGGIDHPTKAVPIAPAVASRPKRNRGDDSGDDSQGGRASKRPSSTPSRARNIALRGARTVLEPAEKPKDDEESLAKLHDTITSAGNAKRFNTMKNATLDVEFLNEAGVCPEFFSPTDPIYVALTFCNPTDSDVYVEVQRYNFPRGGVRVSIEGAEKVPNAITTRAPKVAKKLAPGESHTFTPRQLCAGPKVKDEAELRRLRHNHVPYWTPVKEGTYTAEFNPMEKKCSFVIGARDENAAACSKE